VIVPGTLEMIVNADSICGDRSVSVIFSVDAEPLPGIPSLVPAACMLPTRSGGVFVYGDLLRYDATDTEYVLP
jgi:hypothetical protein